MNILYKSIRIEFNHSPSPRFRFAVKEARAISTFTQNGKTYCVTYDRAEFEDLHRLVGRLKSFIYKKVFIDDVEYPWDEVFAYLWCFELKQKSWKPGQYCHGESRQSPAINPWGCNHARMPLNNEAKWLRFGKFDVDGKTFLFNKDMIAYKFKAHTESFRFCPALDEEKMKSTLDKLPESVNPCVNKDWKYVGITVNSLMVSISAGSDDLEHPAGVCPASIESRDKIFKHLTGKDFESFGA